MYRFELKIVFLLCLEKLQMTSDEKYMFRALSLAKLGIYSVAPNPMVGAVVVCENQIIGEGWHRGYGKAHAEPNAIYSVENQELLSKSTLYVNLEPCSHFGKTSPCADLIVSKKIKRVVIGCLDPNPKVSGRGVKLLKDAGIDVTVGILEAESRELNKRFIVFQEKKRPFVLLKWAQTADGFIDNLRKDKSERALKISNTITRQLAHKMRTENMGIMAGTNTILLDNPSLTVRYWEGRQPVRIVIDRNNSIPDSFIIKDGKVKTLIFTNEELDVASKCEIIPAGKEDLNLSFILNELCEKSIHSVLVEGGAMLLNSFLHAGHWDEANVEISTQTLSQGVHAPVIEERYCTSKQVIEGHVWKQYVNK